MYKQLAGSPFRGLKDTLPAGSSTFTSEGKVTSKIRSDSAQGFEALPLPSSASSSEAFVGDDCETSTSCTTSSSPDEAWDSESSASSAGGDILRSTGWEAPQLAVPPHPKVSLGISDNTSAYARAAQKSKAELPAQPSTSALRRAPLRRAPHSLRRAPPHSP